MTPKVRATKNKLDIAKIKNFSVSEDTTKKVNKTTTTKLKNGRKYLEIIWETCRIYKNSYTSIIKIKISHLNIGKGYERTFLWGSYTNGQLAQEEMLEIISHQGNAYQNCNEIPLYTCKDK